MKKAILIIGIMILMISGCAIGRKTSYEGRSSFNIKPQDGKIIVAVHDMRPYVQDKEKSPDYTGTQRALAGVPWNVSTASGNPLADDLGLMIVNTMLFRNVSASQQKIPYSWSFDEFKQKTLGKEKDSKVFYIKMMEWRTDTYFRLGLIYDVKLTVLDDLANEVFNNQEKGSLTIDATQPGKESLASAISNILEKLFAGTGRAEK
jgi:hypothetical protein